MDLSELPTALVAVGARVEVLADELPTELAERILAAADPPRRTGALAASGQVVEGVVSFGGGPVTYAAAVEAVNPFLTRALEAAAEDALDYAATRLSDATAF